MQKAGQDLATPQPCLAEHGILHMAFLNRAQQFVFFQWEDYQEDTPKEVFFLKSALLQSVEMGLENILP